MILILSLFQSCGGGTKSHTYNHLQRMRRWIGYVAWRLNSLTPGRFEQNFRSVIFKLISVTDGWGISCKIALRSMPLDLTDDKSTLVQVMAWCRQATSHYLSQCWPRFMSPYDVTRPQCDNSLRLRQNGLHFPDDIFKCIFLNENEWISIEISLKIVPKHSISQPPVHPCLAQAIELIAHPKITLILPFSWGFSSKVTFCTP